MRNHNGHGIPRTYIQLPVNYRPQVSKAVRDNLLVRANDFGIELEDIAITHLSFGTEFTRAVEAKQVRARQHAPAGVFAEFSTFIPRFIWDRFA